MHYQLYLCYTAQVVVVKGFITFQAGRKCEKHKIYSLFFHPLHNTLAYWMMVYKSGVQKNGTTMAWNFAMGKHHKMM